jgi:RNA polymerase sigma-70 factor (ECF subfamily)
MISFSQGSVEAFEELFSRYKQPLYGFFRRRLTDPACAEELTQDVFVAVVQGSSHYQPTALFRTYLYAIGFKILLTHRRKTAFRAIFSASSKEYCEPSQRSSLEEDLTIRDAVKKLDRQDREVLLLREFEQLSYSEIAQLLELPLNTVRSRLFRARTALHDLLRPAAAGSPATDYPKSQVEEQV